MVKKLENRLIAFLDVLGFSAMLRTDELVELHEKFSAFIDETKTKTFLSTSGDEMGRTNFEYSQFMSDSLVLVSNPTDDINNVNNFIAAVSAILELGVRNLFPLRGAITLSNVVYDEERNIFLGNRFPSVVKFEESQEWTGCVVLRPAEELILHAWGTEDISKIENKVTSFLHYYAVPQKVENNEKYLCLNYLFPLIFEDLTKFFDFLIEPKKSNTLAYRGHVAEQGFVAQSLSEEFAPATSLVSMTTRTGVRFQFLNKDMQPCESGVKELQWTAIGPC